MGCASRQKRTSAPFPLKYIEIGNENWGAQYIERYNQFYRVLKKKYPQLIYIINDIGRYPDIRPEGYDLFDEHFYVTPQRFLLWHIARHVSGTEKRFM